MANLTPEQQAQFEQELNQAGGGPIEESGAPVAETAPEAQPEAMQPGAEMAHPEAMAQAGADVPAQQPPMPEQMPDPNQAVSALGFGSVDELIAAYQGLSQQHEMSMQQLGQLVALQQAMEAQDDLDPNAPDYAVKKAIREEMAPLYDKMKDEARNKLVQDAWGKSAVEMPDIQEFMPDIAAFFKENPDLAVSEDGLRRSYDAVRSRKYKSERQMMEDPDFIARAAGNEKIKKAVLEAHLGEISRNGDALPSGISEGGGTPLTGKKKQPGSMEQAKAGLLAMLGGQ